MNFLSLFRRKPNPRVTRLLEDIRSGDGILQHHPRIGTPIIYLASGWSVSSVGNRLVSIPDIEVTPREEREICEAIADRVAAYHQRK